MVQPQPKFINNKAWPCVVQDSSGARVKVMPGEVVQGEWFSRFVNHRKGMLPYTGDQTPRHFDRGPVTAVPGGQNPAYAGQLEAAAQLENRQLQDAAKRDAAQQKRIADLEASLNAEKLKSKKMEADVTNAVKAATEAAASAAAAAAASGKGTASTPAGPPPDTGDGKDYLGLSLAEWDDKIRVDGWGAELNKGKLVGLAQFVGVEDSDIENASKKQLVSLITDLIVGEEEGSEEDDDSDSDDSDDSEESSD